jgi:hypothetical protein
LIDVKSLPRTFRAAVDAHQGGASCTPYDSIVAVKPSTISGLSVVVSIAGGFPYGHVALGIISRNRECVAPIFAALHAGSRGRSRWNAATWMPLANVSESENEYLITIELPDVKKEDLKIADGIITIPVLPYRVNSWKLRHGIGMRCASGSSAC